MTTSVASGISGGMDNITQITDLNSFKQAFQSYKVPTLRELNASAAGTSLTFDQLSRQMQSHGAQISRIASQMEEAARRHDGQELCNLSKSMGMVITNILQDAQRAALVAKDPTHKQRLLDSCTTVLTALNHYTSALMAYEADPCEATKAALDLAKLNLENSVEAVMAAMRNIEPDPDMGSLLLELAKNVNMTVDEMCRINSSQPQEVQLLSAQAAHASAEMLETVEVLGQFACDPAVRARIHNQIAKVQPATAKLSGVPGDEQQLLMDDIQSLEEMLITHSLISIPTCFRSCVLLTLLSLRVNALWLSPEMLLFFLNLPNSLRRLFPFSLLVPRNSVRTHPMALVLVCSSMLVRQPLRLRPFSRKLISLLMPGTTR